MVRPWCFRLARTKRWARQGKGGASLGRATPFPLSPPSIGFPLWALLQTPSMHIRPFVFRCCKGSPMLLTCGHPWHAPVFHKGGMHGFRYSPSKLVLSAQGLLAREGPSPRQATR